MAPRAAAWSALFLLGCFPPGEGVSPPRDSIYFPVGFALDSAAEHLFIVNSDFDLQYNAGTVLSWDLAELRARVPRTCANSGECFDGEICDLERTVENRNVPSRWCVPVAGDHALRPCGAYGETSDGDQVLYPGRCGYIDPSAPQDGGSPILRQGPAYSVQIGSFATEALHRTRPVTAPAGARGRLFIPVRGDATLHWIDVESGSLECGQRANDGACDARHRSGDDPQGENTRNASLLPEPFGVDSDVLGETLLVSNQASGAVGLFSHDWSSAGPRYQFTLGDLPSRPIGVAALPVPRTIPANALRDLPGYLVTFRNSGNVFLVRVYDDAGANPARPYVKAWASTPILTNSSGIDSRGIAVDDARRSDAERACAERFGVLPECAIDPACASLAAPGYGDCVAQAAAVPLDVFVANRAPSTLLVGQSRPVVADIATSDLPSFTSTLAVGIGPSRVVVGDVTNAAGERERRVFVVCFDSRRIVVYDPVRRRIETEILTGRGPHPFVIDAEHALGYVGHFTDSYVGVVDLDQRHVQSYGTIIASFGRPTPPRASK